MIFKTAFLLTPLFGSGLFRGQQSLIHVLSLIKCFLSYQQDYCVMQSCQIKAKICLKMTKAKGKMCFVFHCLTCYCDQNQTAQKYCLYYFKYENMMRGTLLLSNTIILQTSKDTLAKMFWAFAFRVVFLSVPCHVLDRDTVLFGENGLRFSPASSFQSCQAVVMWRWTAFRQCERHWSAIVQALLNCTC